MVSTCLNPLFIWWFEAFFLGHWFTHMSQWVDDLLIYSVDICWHETDSMVWIDMKYYTFYINTYIHTDLFYIYIYLFYINIYIYILTWNIYTHELIMLNRPYTNGRSAAGWSSGNRDRHLQGKRVTSRQRRMVPRQSKRRRRWTGNGSLASESPERVATCANSRWLSIWYADMPVKSYQE